MSSNCNVDLTSSSNDINLAGKYYVNDDNNFKKELIKLLEGLKEELKEISGRLYSIETLI